MKRTLIILGLAVLIVVAINVISAKAVQATTIDRCPNQPQVLKTAEGAHKRAAKGWNAKKVKKDKSAIERVRIQSRCAPTKDGRKYVKNEIKNAKKRYKKAKIDRLYNELTASPGQARLQRLRWCESGNRYNDPSAPAGAYGMLQGWSVSLSYYKESGWIKLTGDKPDSPPYTAGKKEQDIRASLLHQHGGSWECAY